MNVASERRLWWLAVGALLALALWPIWSARFPPMQDYPGQLWYVEALRAHGEPGSDYDRYYAFRFHPVYATFYLAAIAFAKLVPIEIAGKLALSIYPLLVALIVVRLARRAERAPWCALLFFPFVFNQQYFFGNIAYFLSLPMIVLALLDFEAFFAAAPSAGSIARHAAWQIALVVTHPLSYLAFVGLALIDALLLARRTNEPWRKLGVSLAIVLAVLGAVALAERGTRMSAMSGMNDVTWLGPIRTLEFWSFMFDGMQSWSRVEPATVSLWIGVAVVLVAGSIAAHRKLGRAFVPGRYAILLAVATAVMFAAPFGIGIYTYLNVRLAALVYFLFALCVARMPLDKRLATALVALLGACMIDSIAKQRRLSTEAAEVLPIVNAMAPHARILPLMFDPGSDELDRYWFAPHVQEYDYYHVLVGGGFNPYVQGSSVDPVRPNPGEARAAPSLTRPDQFDWQKHSADYDYFVLRGVPEGATEYFERTCERIAASGAWMLFKRKSP